MKDRLGDKIRLQHIFNAILEIENYIKNINQSEFESNSLIFFASLMQLEIVGEASTRLSDDCLLNNSDIPWKNIRGLRNLIFHKYFGLDKNTIWDIIINELPTLKIQITTILNKS